MAGTDALLVCAPLPAGAAGASNDGGGLHGPAVGGGGGTVLRDPAAAAAAATASAAAPATCAAPSLLQPAASSGLRRYLNPLVCRAAGQDPERPAGPVAELSDYAKLVNACLFAMHERQLMPSGLLDLAWSAGLGLQQGNVAGFEELASTLRTEMTRRYLWKLEVETVAATAQQPQPSSVVAAGAATNAAGTTSLLAGGGPAAGGMKRPAAPPAISKRAVGLKRVRCWQDTALELGGTGMEAAAPPRRQRRGGEMRRTQAEAILGGFAPPP
ncbi:hypothetical protein CHLRE_16g690506v5 [Chlamydomonas reinhardtii]|uniref:Uncharacterized protein n=1 Tax=Chlamydomonas reinhardtii TaxID=3055 RepID=A0A2K3CU90_CHLRE|nr:uncharacterized protein CHLRE_16g690506v5 [Chlamydomonas reinhardtii]XP_042915793.1 uncharacterized protein CHLRE_16g690506v5 [Chlamydomonas reinhardtii]PNW71841.1 hypothetical protein CHLRE_16g690506v5 [Chlamydomonas reinhardtii]PNW71842.1 hypothetical protein CHLRE_16g690506v5 [Chlamydomonas reinhardtii]